MPANAKYRLGNRIPVVVNDSYESTKTLLTLMLKINQQNEINIAPGRIADFYCGDVKQINITNKIRSLFILLIAVSFFLTACTGSPIRIHIPQNRFELPETTGQRILGLEVGYDPGEYTISFTDNSQTEPIKTDNPEILKTVPGEHKGSDLELRFIGHYGVMDRFEVLAGINSGTDFGLKYQFLGKSRLQSAEGDFSAAVAIIRRGSGEEDEDDDFTVKSRTWDYSILGGYKTTDKLLLYTSAFKSKIHYTINIAATALNSYQDWFTGNVDVQGFTLGLNYRVHTNIDLTFEAVNSRIESRGSEREDQFYGIKIGFVF